MTVKVCFACENTKPITEFYSRPSRPNKHDKRCHACRRTYVNQCYAANKHRYKVSRAEYAAKNKDKQKQLTRAYSETIHGRSKILIKSAKQRATQKGREFSIDLDFVKSRLHNGKCEVTGIDFDLSPHDRLKNNPFSPSLDRKDPTGGYTPENTRAVLWQYNAMKMDLFDDEVRAFFALFLERLNT